MKRLLWIALLIPVMTLPQTGKGVVAGRLRTPDGGPAAGVRVAMMALSGTNDPAPGVLDGIASTDAAGNFRMENIAPGRYYIVAGLVDSPTYFPGVATATDATVITVTSTTPVTGMDFPVLRSSTPFKVSGQVTGLPAMVPGVRPISLIPRPTPGARGARPIMPVQSTVKSDGTFVFPEVRPGTYNVSLAGLVLAQPVLVTVTDRDVASLDLTAVDPDAVTRQQGLEKTWSLDGPWGGIAADEKTGNLQATRTNGALRLEIDSSGKTLGSNTILPNATLRIARLSTGGAPAFLSFGTWSPKVQAFDSAGAPLWSYPDTGQGIDDVWAADLDGDDIDEVIVGFNGSTGMHVLNASGQLLWQSTGLGNIWHVSAGDVMGDGKPRVVTTSAAGRVHIFSTDGKEHRDLDAGLYANMVRVGKLSAQDRRATIVVAGTVNNGPPNSIGVAALSGDGTKQWSLQLEAPTPSAGSAAFAPGRPWIALGLQGGIVYVVDAEKGAVLASINGQGFTPEVAWMKDAEKGVPVLAISTRNKLNAYRIAGK